MTGLYSTLGRYVLFGLCRTLRVEETNGGFTRDYALNKKQNVIFAFWHNRLFFMTYYLATRYLWRGHNVVVFSSHSRDGEIMARLETKLGAAVVRGSTSRGGIEGLINLYRKARTGYSPVITPDGPRGPKYEVHDGLLFLAKKTGYPVIPISWTSNRFHHFKSWDGFMMPKLFTKIQVVYGKPIFADKNTDKEQLRSQIKNALMEITMD